MLCFEVAFFRNKASRPLPWSLYVFYDSSMTSDSFVKSHGHVRSCRRWNLLASLSLKLHLTIPLENCCFGIVQFLLLILSSCFFLLLDTAGTNSALAHADFTDKAFRAISVLAFLIGTCSTTKTSVTTAAAMPMLLSWRHGGKRTGGQHYAMLGNRDMCTLVSHQVLTKTLRS